MAQITLACGNVVLVDDEDVSLVNESTWRYCHSSKNKFYVTRGESPLPSKTYRALHRAILNAQHGQEVDHINGNTLDNRRCNLRLVTHAQNMRNAPPKKQAGRASRYRGVSLCKDTGRWRVSISDGSRYRQIGRHSSEIAAAFAYDLASLELHGEFGRRNFLPLC